VAQIFGANPETIREASRIVVSLGFDGVDLNMGCPDKAVEKQGAGAALIKNPKLARELIKAAKEGAKVGKKSIPVSVKTRLGYRQDELEIWLPEILAEEPAVVTIHTRTRQELSKVSAHWERICRAVEIRNELGSKTLIIGNGDVVSLTDAREKARESGADGIMFGRAIFGNPFLFAKKKCPEGIEGRELLLKVLLEHAELFEKLMKGTKNFDVMKKHFKAYVSGWQGAKELRQELMRVTSASELARVIRRYLKSGLTNVTYFD
jgi:tRNA-dihydrouridine synthase